MGVFSPHVPHSYHSITSAGAEDIQGWMERQAVDTRKMSVIMSYDLVRLEIPALDHLVLSTAKQVGMSSRYFDTANAADVPGQGQFELAGCQIPKFSGLLLAIITDGVSMKTYIVLSPEPDTKNWLSGSTANDLTHPILPANTRNGTQGLCHSGFACLNVSFLTSALDGVSLIGVGPVAFGAAPLPPARNANCIDCASFAWSAFSDTPSIIFCILGFEAFSSAFWLLIFLRRSAAVVAAAAIFAARTGGSSRTCSYSLRIRLATPTWWATSEGATVVGVMVKLLELEAWSSAESDAKSAAKISRVRFAEVRTA
jgi:hypothetical protein